MSYAVLVLERPWWPVSQDPAQTSIAPFLDGLSRLDGLSVFYATFFDTRSLGLALEYLMDARKLDGIKKVIIYVASHGSGARIGGEDGPGINLSTVFDRIARHGRGKVAGVMLDVCDVGMEYKTIEQGMVRANIRWVTGFAASLDWLTCTSIHLHLLSALCQLKVPHLTRKKQILAAVQQAMAVFNPYLEIPDDDEDDEEDPEEDDSDDDDLDDFDDLDDDTDAASDEDDESEMTTLSVALTVMIRPNNAAPELLDAEQIWPMLADE